MAIQLPSFWLEQCLQPKAAQKALSIGVGHTHAPVSPERVERKKHKNQVRSLSWEITAWSREDGGASNPPFSSPTERQNSWTAEGLDPQGQSAFLVGREKDQDGKLHPKPFRKAKVLSWA